MIRGTTAQFKFKLPYRYDELDTVTITFWQSIANKPNVLVKKVKSNCNVSSDDDYCLCVSLTPSETLMFSDKLKAKVQLRAISGANTFASREQLITVYPINNEVIDTELPPPDKNGWVILDGEKI